MKKKHIEVLEVLRRKYVNAFQPTNSNQVVFLEHGLPIWIVPLSIFVELQNAGFVDAKEYMHGIQFYMSNIGARKYKALSPATQLDEILLTIDPDKVYNVQQVAALLKIASCRVQARIARGHLRAVGRIDTHKYEIKGSDLLEAITPTENWHPRQKWNF